MGILEQILASVDNVRRVAAKNTKDFISNPADFLSMVQGRVSEQNKKLAAGDKETLSNMASDMLPGGGAVGMIRKGGRPDLNITHETSLQNIIRLLSGRSSLTNPSLAIASNEVAPFRGLHDSATSIVMNPAAAHYFDPAKNKAAQLANRDTYTTLHKDLLPADFRTANPESLRLTEGVRSRRMADYLRAGSPVQDVQHMLSILGSPEFKSLSEYERSRYGARILNPKQALSEKATEDALQQNFPDVLEALRSSDTKLLDAGMTLDVFKKRAKAGDKESQKLFDILGSTKSDYAELKLPGELPLNSNTVSAMIIPGYKLVDASETAARQVRNLAEKKGIRAGTPAELLPADLRSLYDDLASALFESVKSSTATPPTKYLNAFDRKILGQQSGKEGVEMTKQFMQESGQFAADVASILTARDVTNLK